MQDNQLMKRTQDGYLYSPDSNGDLISDQTQSDIAYLTLNSGFIPPLGADPPKFDASPKRRISRRP